MRARAAAGLLAALAGAGCSSGPAGRAALEDTVGPQFASLYQRQQSLLERIPPSRTQVAAGATCDRGGPAVADEGAGDDWTCLVSYTDADGTARQAPYELAWAADGCYRADGPPGLVGQQRMRTPAGDAVTNPLYAFDGCVPQT